jgi:hypothetical protein
MNTSELIAAIDTEISRLQQARQLLADNTATRGGKPTLLKSLRMRHDFNGIELRELWNQAEVIAIKNRTQSSNVLRLHE